jgi:hypothetical protein
MNNSDLIELAGYLANPVRRTRIEIEAKQSKITEYDNTYHTMTGFRLPVNSSSVTILDDSADKWGVESRIYFVMAEHDVLPPSVQEIITSCNRPDASYEIYTTRLNNKAVIEKLFNVGFLVGDVQDEDRIRSMVGNEANVDFERGFNHNS